MFRFNLQRIQETLNAIWIQLHQLSYSDVSRSLYIEISSENIVTDYGKFKMLFETTIIPEHLKAKFRFNYFYKLSQFLPAASCWKLSTGTYEALSLFYLLL